MHRIAVLAVLLAIIASGCVSPAAAPTNDTDDSPGAPVPAANDIGTATPERARGPEVAGTNLDALIMDLGGLLYRLENAHHDYLFDNMSQATAKAEADDLREAIAAAERRAYSMGFDRPYSGGEGGTLVTLVRLGMGNTNYTALYLKWCVEKPPQHYFDAIKSGTGSDCSTVERYNRMSINKFWLAQNEIACQRLSRGIDTVVRLTERCMPFTEHFARLG